MIITKKDRIGCLNEITQYLDKYLILDCDWVHTYIYEKPFGDHWIIRIPGSTVGNLKVKDNKVESINLYEEDCIDKLKYYDKSVLKELKQFIGKEIVFEKS